MAAGRVTVDPTVEACAPKVCGNNKADAAGTFEAAEEKTSMEFSALEETACFAAGGQDMTESFLAGGGGEYMEDAQTKRKMYMSQEDMDVILSHEARGDRFKQFQARIRKEVQETGHFEISEEYVNKVFQQRAWMRQQCSDLRSQYPNLVWEQDDDDHEEAAAAVKSD
ncbi:hypothetical protein ZWY2020_059849 [Hordeum vulgare]|nr:hypothetical protein ZWY2020_059849 [Hordeum vulgare]